MTNKRLEADIAENILLGDEEPAGYSCPVCGYPVVTEMGLDVCYQCGWYEGIEEE
jgi:uncharacterized Zn finger protein (UPF0148 family)